MRYCIDASALIDLGERHYPERVKVFSPIWESLYEGVEDGSIISVDYVKIELERKADEWRSNFYKRANEMFLISQEIEQEFAGVIRDIETDDRFPVNKHRERFMGGADPWVIALSRRVGDCVVVSAENKPIASYGLGPVCVCLGVSHMNLIEFFEARNIGI